MTYDEAVKIKHSLDKYNTRFIKISVFQNMRTKDYKLYVIVYGKYSKVAGEANSEIEALVILKAILSTLLVLATSSYIKPQFMTDFGYTTKDLAINS